MLVTGFRSWIKYQIFMLIIQDRKTVLVNILSHLAVDERFLGTKLLRPLERKTILKGTLASHPQFHKWKLSNHEKLLACLDLLAISIGTSKYEQT